MEFDAIVVGAGPAGSSAAREIARRGWRVLVLDRAEFPRDKPCGGGVSVPCAALIPFNIDAVIERRISGFILGDPRSGTAQRDMEAPFLYMTQRAQLDSLLLKHAIDAGAVFQSGQFVTHVGERGDGTFDVRSKGGTDGEMKHHVRLVVGADGANGVVGRALGFAPPEETAVALEGRLPCPQGVPEWLEHRIAVAPGVVPGGYGWLFPKGDHINIGVGGWKPAGPLLRDALKAYMHAYGWAFDDLEGVEGHLLPLRTKHDRLAIRGAALAGDAAGFVDALSGGGIEHAIMSGTLLGPVAAAYLAGGRPDLSDYQDALETRLYPSLDRSRALAELVYAAPGALLAPVIHSDRALDAVLSAAQRSWSVKQEPTFTALLWGLAGAAGEIARQVSIWRYGPR